MSVSSQRREIPSNFNARATRANHALSKHVPSDASSVSLVEKSRGFNFSSSSNSIETQIGWAENETANLLAIFFNAPTVNFLN